MIDRLKWQKDYRLKNGNIRTKVYEKTRKGKLVRTYRNMLSRVLGIQKKKEHLYSGLAVLDKELFYEWSLRNSDFNTLFDAWVKSGYDRKLSPSIDRKDTSVGYTLENIQWITHSENSRQGGLAKNV